MRESMDHDAVSFDAARLDVANVVHHQDPLPTDPAWPTNLAALEAQIGKIDLAQGG